MGVQRSRAFGVDVFIYNNAQFSKFCEGVNIIRRTLHFIGILFGYNKTK